MPKNEKLIAELIKVGDQFPGTPVVGKNKEETKKNIEKLFQSQRAKNK